MPSPPSPPSPRHRTVLPIHRTLLGLIAALAAVACGGAGDRPGEDAPVPQEAATDPASGAEAPVHAVASLPPLAWFVERIGGERVAVDVFIPPGASPHAFEPSPRQVVALEEADLVVEVGHPDFAFEQQHLERLVRDRSRKDEDGDGDGEGDGGVELVRFSDGLDLEGGALRDEDPHLWVSPALARPAAERIAGALERIDPAGADVYRRNLADLLADVDGLDRHLRETLDGLSHRTFLVQHPAWGHFAARYGLHQVSIEHEGKEPTPRSLATLVERARREGVEVVFVQPGVSAAAAEAVAREIGARVVPLDPLEHDWLANLRRVGDVLGRSLEEADEAEEANGDSAPHREGGTP